jgi:hypothetical protein
MENGLLFLCQLTTTLPKQTKNCFGKRTILFSERHMRRVKFFRCCVPSRALGALAAVMPLSSFACISFALFVVSPPGAGTWCAFEDGAASGTRGDMDRFGGAVVRLLLCVLLISSVVSKLLPPSGGRSRSHCRHEHEYFFLLMICMLHYMRRAAGRLVMPTSWHVIFHQGFRAEQVEALPCGEGSCFG